MGLGLGLSFKPNMLKILLSILELSGVGCVLLSSPWIRWIVAKWTRRTRTVVDDMVTGNCGDGFVTDGLCLQLLAHRPESVFQWPGANVLTKRGSVNATAPVGIVFSLG